MNKILKSALILAAVLTSSTSLFGQRAVMVNSSNSVLLYPNNFWSVNASAARAGLGLAPYVTNPVVPLTNGGTGATNAAAVRTNLGLGWSALTNTNASSALLGYTTNGNIVSGTNALFFTNTTVNFQSISASTNVITSQLFIADEATLFFDGDGAGNFRTNLGLGATWLTNTNVTNFRTAIGLGTVSGVFFESLETENNIFSGGDITALNAIITGPNGLLFSGGGEVITRTNLGLGWSALTNTNAINFRAAINLGWSALTNTNAATSLLGVTTNGQVVANTTNTLTFTNVGVGFGGDGFAISGNTISGPVNSLSFEDGAFTGTLYMDGGSIQFSGTTNAATTRTNLGLGATWLTNTNVTNFRADIGLGTTSQATFRSLVVSNSTENLVASFNAVSSTPLEVYVADEDLAAGYGSSAYAIGVGQSGFQVKYGASDTNWGYPVLTDGNGYVVNPSNFWQLAPIATTVTSSTPITNSTNTATNSRNLILTSLSPAINNVTNTLLLPTNTSTFNGDTALVIHAGGSGSATAIRQAGSATNLIVLTNFDHAVRFLYSGNAWDFYHNLAYVEPIYFSGTNAEANAAASRTNLGLGWSALTNTNNVNFRAAVDLSLPALTNTNNANFQAAVFATNTTPAAGANLGDAKAWMEVTVSTNGTNHSFRIPLFQ